MKVLLIEDDKLISRMYKKALSAEGLEVQVSSNGSEGLEKVKSYKPDLILLDIMMPKMNGLEVLKRLKADEELKSIPVFMLTNLSGTQDAEKSKNLGAEEFMVKSEFKPKEIAIKVKKYITEKSTPPKVESKDGQSPNN